MLGIDACENSVLRATNHKKLDQRRLSNNLEYRLSTIENLEKEKGEAAFDIITCMEVIEHVTAKGPFLGSVSKLLRPGGILFMSTMDKSLGSLLGVKIAGEYSLRLVAAGTHDWNKFIDPGDLKKLLSVQGLDTIRLQGVIYNPISGKMQRVNCSTQYMLAARKK